MPCFFLTSLLLVAEEAAAAAETAESTGLLNMDRLPLLGVAVFFVVAVVFWISVARSGGQIKVREIAGLKAIEEAVAQGSATRQKLEDARAAFEGRQAMAYHGWPRVLLAPLRNFELAAPRLSGVSALPPRERRFGVNGGNEAAVDAHGTLAAVRRLELVLLRLLSSNRTPPPPQ